MICGIENKKANMVIGVERTQSQKKPILVIKEGNKITKYASFINERSAIEFIDKLFKLCEERGEQSNV